uniref:Ovule protein n=1 Tax=Haemonchus placei TaxID=6290 RepID=A0A158QK81_HAEPC
LLLIWDRINRLFFQHGSWTFISRDRELQLKVTLPFCGYYLIISQQDVACNVRGMID